MPWQWTLKYLYGTLNCDTPILESIWLEWNKHFNKPLTFTADQSWSATKLLKRLCIKNPKLEENLRVLDEEDLKMIPRVEWPTQLANWGAEGTQSFKVTQALFRAGLIN